MDKFEIASLGYISRDRLEKPPIYNAVYFAWLDFDRKVVGEFWTCREEAAGFLKHNSNNIINDQGVRILISGRNIHRLRGKIEKLINYTGRLFGIEDRATAFIPTIKSCPNDLDGGAVLHLPKLWVSNISTISLCMLLIKKFICDYNIKKAKPLTSIREWRKLLPEKERLAASFIAKKKISEAFDETWNLNNPREWGIRTFYINEKKKINKIKGLRKYADSNYL